MDFSAAVLTEAQQAFAQEVRTFLDEQLTPEVYAGMRERSSSFDEGFYLAMGAKGWLWPRWRKEDGGAELDDVSAKILEAELRKRDAQIGLLATTGLVWPAIEAAAGVRALAARLRAGAPSAAEERIQEQASAFARDDESAALALERLDPERDRLVIFVGKLIRNKGVDLLLAAWPLSVPT